MHFPCRVRRQRVFRAGYPWLLLQIQPRRVSVKAATIVLVLMHGPPPAPPSKEGQPDEYYRCMGALHKDVKEPQRHMATVRYKEGSECSPWRPHCGRCGSKACVSPLCLFYSHQVGGSSSRW